MQKLCFAIFLCAGMLFALLVGDDTFAPSRGIMTALGLVCAMSGVLVLLVEYLPAHLQAPIAAVWRVLSARTLQTAPVRGTIRAARRGSYRWRQTVALAELELKWLDSEFWHRLHESRLGFLVGPPDPRDSMRTDGIPRHFDAMLTPALGALPVPPYQDSQAPLLPHWMTPSWIWPRGRPGD